MGRQSRRKGYRGEHDVERLFRECGFDARRVPLSGASSFQKGDIVVFENGTPKWIIEVKRRAEGFKEFYKWLEGAHFVFCRADRSPWLVVMRSEEFLKLLREKEEEDKTTKIPITFEDLLEVIKQMSNTEKLELIRRMLKMLEEDMQTNKV